MRVVDAEAETATKHSTPVLITQLHSLEKHGSEVYTHNIFKLFQDEILRESALVVANRVDEGQDRRLYYLEHYSRRECKWTVEYNPFDSRIKCCCLMFESFGLPCCHMISVMKYEHLVAIPHNLIMQRWTRFARLDSPTFRQIPDNMTSMARYGILSSGYNLMSFYASQTHESFQQARQVEHEMTSWMRERWEMVKKQRMTEEGEPSSVGSPFGVGDPVKVKTKGNPGKKELVMQTRQSNRVDASKDVAGPSHKTNTRKRKVGAAPTEPRKSRNQSKSNGVFDDEDDIIQKALVLDDIKMPKEQLGSYATRSVICERIVAVRELTKYKIPYEFCYSDGLVKRIEDKLEICNDDDDEDEDENKTDGNDDDEDESEGDANHEDDESSSDGDDKEVSIFLVQLIVRSINMDV
ncbi:hypothetical protein Vadar_020501 [Vaccinium darrowii]|uniref:Uncharacterized protein n=1 Tax=Vaccinium darrowii TaxID=229202 RepID=A0ACB7YYW1_9ERIC|nr:hypothetical protein Vadar_020501 [Vaccinium darrowii]